MGAAAAEILRNPVSKHQIQLNPSHETKFSGANNGEREILIFPIQLTTNRIDNRITRLIHTMPYIGDYHIHNLYRER